jgi:dihydrofolate synthase/folylpolyglutamate synthase
VSARRLGSFGRPVIRVGRHQRQGLDLRDARVDRAAAGYRVGLYIKPHLVHFEERCRVNGEMVPAQSLVPHFEAVERARANCRSRTSSSRPSPSRSCCRRRTSTS